MPSGTRSGPHLPRIFRGRYGSSIGRPSIRTVPFPLISTVSPGSPITRLMKSSSAGGEMPSPRESHTKNAEIGSRSGSSVLRGLSNTITSPRRMSPNR